ncbi:MAG: OmpA family protein [Acidobacteriota bacterium]|nr:OmpA family protein [Acidobacteriota bacterium]
MRRRRKVEEPSSRDRWMVSYADFITVLFAFFVVLFASVTPQGPTIKNISKSIHHGFVDLEPFSGAASRDESLQPQLVPDGLIQAHAVEGSSLPKGDGSGATGIDIEQLRRQLEAAIGQELKAGQVTLRVTPEGFVISLKELGFFDSGQAALRSGATAKIEQIAKVLSQHGFYLRVEGHSDDQPIHTPQFDSNWQLSTARAMAVLVLLTNESGLDPAKISLAGYGQYRPIADNASSEGRRMNRRVDLVVVGGVEPHPFR